MTILVSLVAAVALVVFAYAVEMSGGQYFLGVVVPYAAFSIFVLGFVYRILEWARVPVPFRIPTTCGQQETLPWIKQDKLEAPKNGFEVVGRMFLEVFFFRSLFRN